MDFWKIIIDKISDISWIVFISFEIGGTSATALLIWKYCSTKRPFRTFLVEFPFLIFQVGFQRIVLKLGSKDYRKIYYSYSLWNFKINILEPSYIEIIRHVLARFLTNKWLCLFWSQKKILIKKWCQYMLKSLNVAPKKCIHFLDFIA